MATLLLIDFDLLKAAISTNAKPEIVFLRFGRHTALSRWRPRFQYFAADNMVRLDLRFRLYTSYDTIRLTCSKKLTGFQLSLPHGINKKLKCETLLFWSFSTPPPTRHWATGRSDRSSHRQKYSISYRPITLVGSSRMRAILAGRVYDSFYCSFTPLSPTGHI